VLKGIFWEWTNTRTYSHNICLLHPRNFRIKASGYQLLSQRRIGYESSGSISNVRCCYYTLDD